MDGAKNESLRVRFDSRLKLRFCGSKVTSDAGLLTYLELDEALGLTEMGEDILTDSRTGTNKQHLLAPLLRQSIYSRLDAGIGLEYFQANPHGKYRKSDPIPKLHSTQLLPAPLSGYAL